jgi:Family of unknown function (DUF5906)
MARRTKKMPRVRTDGAGQTEITVFACDGGTLSKQIKLGDDGKAEITAAANMGRGRARRMPVSGASELAQVIRQLKNYEAITLGALRGDLPDKVKVTTKEKLNGAAGVIARDRDHLEYLPDRPAIVLFDYDSKWKPAKIVVKDYWETLVKVCPGLRDAERLVRASTSSGLYNTKTGKDLPASGGVHIYLTAKDGKDSKRFLETLFERCWLAGFGWIMLAENGRMLERSIIDKTVWTPEHLCFEAGPILTAPLAQRAERREPIAFAGKVIDTLAICPSLTTAERTRFDERVAAAKAKMNSKAAKVRAAYDEPRIADLVSKGVSREAAAAQIESLHRDVLTSDTKLDFSDPKLKDCYVGDVLNDPKRFEKKYLRDPGEPTYGRSKAIVLLRQSDGWPWIKSFAHGDGVSYSLKYSAAARAEMTKFELLRADQGEAERITKSVTESTDKQTTKTNGSKPGVSNAGTGVKLRDFYAYMPMHNYIFAPSRDMWPAASVNSRIAPIVIGYDKEKKENITIKASTWIDWNQPVEQMTWAPGLPMIIANRLISEGGWIERKGVSCFNLYRPPTIKLGDASKAKPWIDLVHKVFPSDADHMVKYFAHCRQRPQEKINHGIVMGSQAQGVGKDTILEPVKRAIAPWNFKEVAPRNIFDSFNPWRRAVILRVNEAKDMGDVSRFELYDGMKTILAAPPDVLDCNEKHIKQHYILNCMGVIITTNHLTDGIYLPAEDRRHYVAWSDCQPTDFTRTFWDKMWKWYDAGGDQHVAAYLATLDISDFDPKAPPLKTPAFWSIVNANRTTEEAELQDVLDTLGNPDAVTIAEIVGKALLDFSDWLLDRRNRKAVNHRLENCGYRAVNNPDAKDGMWLINDRRPAFCLRPKPRNTMLIHKPSSSATTSPESMLALSILKAKSIAS